MEDALQILGTKTNPEGKVTKHDTDAAVAYNEKITKHFEILKSQWNLTKL